LEQRTARWLHPNRGLRFANIRRARGQLKITCIGRLKRRAIEQAETIELTASVLGRTVNEVLRKAQKAGGTGFYIGAIIDSFMG
jgi:hypothetical protein